MTSPADHTPSTPAAAAGTITIKGLGAVNRLGFGAMRLTGDGIWGEPDDPDQARAVARRAVELGVDFIDTADSYGPDVSERILHEALHPYPDGLRIATKAGLLRTGPNEWPPCGRPEHLRQQIEMSRRILGVDTLDLLQLHRIDPQVERAAQFAELAALQGEGKSLTLGLSQVSVDEIRAAEQYFTVSTVQNRYSLTDRSSQDVLDYCAENSIVFIPWAPLGGGNDSDPTALLSDIAERHHATPAQVKLAWVLQRSPWILPIPGTGSVRHLEENVAAAAVELDDDAIAALDAA